jgi:TctA family transporter
MQNFVIKSEILSIATLKVFRQQFIWTIAVQRISGLLGFNTGHSLTFQCALKKRDVLPNIQLLPLLKAMYPLSFRLKCLKS